MYGEWYGETYDNTPYSDESGEGAILIKIRREDNTGVVQHIEGEQVDIIIPDPMIDEVEVGDYIWYEEDTDTGELVAEYHPYINLDYYDPYEDEDYYL